MRYRGVPWLALVAGLMLAVAGCGGSDEGSTAKPKATVAAGESGKMLGPNGEESTPAKDVQLTPEEEAKVKEGNYTAALVWHEDSTFTRALGLGIKKRLTELGVEVIATTDATFNAGKQRNDVESVMARKPDVIFSIPVDPTTAAAAYRPAVEAGTKLVFLSNTPQGFEYGKDYVGVVSGDQIETGDRTAKLLGDALGGKGKVGVIFHDAKFFITNQRDAAFRDALERMYPDIEIAAEAGFESPDRVAEVARGMLTRNPDLDGIYTTWAEPGQGVLSALRDVGRSDKVKLATVDLSEAVALDMAKGGATVGLTADDLVEAGRTMANVGGYGLVGKAGPKFAVAPSLAITKDNLLEAWKQAYGEDAPASVKKALGQ
jgi:ribose transport system substrate-binding protein